MTPLPFEILLPIGALVFYLYDCVVPLYGNEVLLVQDIRGWRIQAATPFVLGGRRLGLLDPFQPQAPTFRLVIDAASLLNSRRDGIDIRSLINALIIHRILCVLLAALIVLVLPIVSLLLGPGLMLLAVFGAAYAIALIAGGLVWVHRERLGLTSRKALGLIFDGLLCPPFGVNLVRKLTMQADVGDASSFVRQVADASAVSAFRDAARRLLQADVVPGDPALPETEQAIRLLDDDEAWR